MMIRIFLIVSVLCFCSKTKAQNHWDSLGVGFSGPAGDLRFFYTDTTTNLLYTGNYANTMADGLPIYGIASWNGSDWDSLGSGFTNGIGSVPTGWPSCGIRYNGVLYFGGGFQVAGGKPIKNMAIWDGNNWDSLPQSPNDHVSDFAIYHNKLYVCGYFTAVGNNTSMKYIARWNGTTWENVGDVLQFVETFPNFDDLCVYNDELYVGGKFDDSVGTPIHIIRWDDTEWKYVDQGIQQGGIGSVNVMKVYNSNLWIGGTFSATAAGGTSNNLTRWDGNQFQNIGGVGPDEDVRSMHVHNNKLYVGGLFYSFNNIPCSSLAIFDGQKWCTTGSDLTNSSIKCMATYNDSLIIGGGFAPIDGTNYNHIAMWTGGYYTDSCMNANLSIDENDSERITEINIYPNSNNGNFNISFNISFNSAKIKIYDGLGRIVFSENQKNISKANILSLKIPGNIPGLYLLSVETEKGIFTSKILVD